MFVYTTSDIYLTLEYSNLKFIQYIFMKLLYGTHGLI